MSGANNSFSAFNLPTKSAAERLVAREKKKEQKSEAGASNVESPYNSNTAVNMSLPSQPVVQAPAETKPVEEATQEASKQRVDSFEASFFNAPPPPAKEEAEEDEDEFDSFFIKSPDQRAPSFSGNVHKRSKSLGFSPYCMCVCMCVCVCVCVYVGGV